MSGPRYAELQCTSHFSFLRGASSCEELFAEAAQLVIEALAITYRNSLAGIVRAHEAAKATGVPLIVGCRLDLTDGMSVLVYPTDRPAYARLCRPLSLGKKRGGKAQCYLDWSDVVAYGEGLIAIRHRRALPLLARRACLSISGRGDDAWLDAAAGARKTHSPGLDPRSLPTEGLGTRDVYNTVPISLSTQSK